MSTRSDKAQNVNVGGEPKVPSQVTIPKRVKRALNLKSLETGSIRRAIVLEALREVGVSVTDNEIASWRGTK